VPHAVLNAKFHEKEAEIVKDAGQKGRITIATNMAGRGTDIVLGEGVREAGGLHIIGSERHESRRIDNQLRGRSGRQGDRGSSRFYLSLEDDLMRIFGSDRIAPIMQKLGMQEGEAIEHKMVSKAIERAQKRVEGHNFDIRKHLLEYDDVMNTMRQYVYSMRKQILEDDNITEMIQGFFDDVIENNLILFLPGKNFDEWEMDSLNQWLDGYEINLGLNDHEIAEKNLDEMQDHIRNLIKNQYAAKKEEVGEDNFFILEKIVALQVIDQRWKDHLYEIDHLKEGIWTMGYAERNPIVEYRIQSFDLFEQLVGAIKEETLEFIFKAQIEGPLEEHIPDEYHMTGEAIHNDTQSYGVSDSFAINPEENVMPPQMNNRPKSQDSEAAKRTGGGSSKRKKGRKKKKK